MINAPPFRRAKIPLPSLFILATNVKGVWRTRMPPPPRTKRKTGQFCQGHWAQSACKMLCSSPFLLLSCPRSKKQGCNCLVLPFEWAASRPACALAIIGAFLTARISERRLHPGPDTTILPVDAVRVRTTGRCVSRRGQWHLLCLGPKKTNRKNDPLHGANYPKNFRIVHEYATILSTKYFLIIFRP